MSSWIDLVDQAPALARFGAERMAIPPSYLATVRADGRPRVHPVTPIVAPMGLFLFMEPSSPKGSDLREGRPYALHTRVPDDAGTGGEFWITGHGQFIEDPVVQGDVAEAASYDPQPHYVLFELTVLEARGNGYGDVPLPDPRRWSAGG